MFIFCDGAKLPEHQAGVEATRHVVHELAASLDAEVVEQPENLGLARSIISGVTSLVEQYNQVIVVEDDLILSRDFLDYMLQALDRYKDNPQVYQISGFMFPIVPPPQADTFFLPLTTSWGWATWARAWAKFDANPRLSDDFLTNPQIQQKFDLEGSYPCTAMLRDRLAGKNEAWDILWWYAVFNERGFVLYPKKSLVNNNGVDGTGVHAGKSRFMAESLYIDVSQTHIAKPLIFPTMIASDPTIWPDVKRFLRNQQWQIHALWPRIKRKLGTMLKGFQP